MEIKIEFGDRYSSASTHHNLGMVAQTQENYTEARANLQTALEIYVEYQDEYMATVTREKLEGLPE
ncbi:tetratricopeptide repeat protein [Nostoc sp.]|uniref:tetratricopeptide repeat protein n=1 Tax=Nostoc sp. TaxID=1180 RepID=UPI002FF99638